YQWKGRKKIARAARCTSAKGMAWMTRMRAPFGRGIDSARETIRTVSFASPDDRWNSASARPKRRQATTQLSQCTSAWKSGQARVVDRVPERMTLILVFRYARRAISTVPPGSGRRGRPELRAKPAANPNACELLGRNSL